MKQRKNKRDETKTLIDVILETRRTIAPKEQVIRDKKRASKKDVSGRKTTKHKERD